MLSKRVSEQQYEDKLLAFFGIPLITVAVVHIGNDNTLSWLVNNASYYTDLLLALLLTSGGWYMIKKVILRLDHCLPWHRSVVLRLCVQFVITTALSCFITSIVEISYLEFGLGISVSTSSMLTLEIPLTILFVFIVNLLYTILYLLNVNSLANTAQVRIYNPTGQTYPEPGQPESKPGPAMAELPGRLLVQSGKSVVPIALKEISYVSSIQETVFVRTIDNKEYAYMHSLDQLMQDLPQETFFRVNRNVILHVQAVKRFSVDETRRITIETIPARKEPVVVSKNKAASFKNWLQVAET